MTCFGQWSVSKTDLSPLGRSFLSFWGFFVCLFFVFVFCLFKATPAVYGGPQARGQIGTIAAGLHHSHSKARSEPRLRPIPQLTGMPDPQPTE